jgi:hypothetical protein
MKTVLKIILTISTILPVSAMAARYSVPVSKDLEKFATFEVASPEISDNGNAIKVVYHLPAELVGPDFKGIEMQMENYHEDKFKLSSPQGKANCVRSDVNTQCALRMKNLGADFSAAKTFILSKNIPNLEKQGQLKVLRAFSGDPVGILTY